MSIVAKWLDGLRCPLGMEAGLGPGDFVLDGDPAPPEKRHSPSHRPTIFGQCLLWPNGCMDQDATWYINLGTGSVMLDGVPAPPKRGIAPSFRPMSIVEFVAKRLDGRRRT